MIRFNIATDNYMVLIQQIRDWAKDPKRVSHGRPVLPYPPSTMQQAQYMDIELRARDANQRERVLTVKIRRHDLYVVGYRMEGANNWLEFKGKTSVIPNSVSLGFGGNYDNLGGLDKIDNLKMGYSTLKALIADLAVTTVSDIRKSSLRALLIMISESVRFQKLSDIFGPKMQKREDVKFETWMKTLINDWSDLSNRLLCEDQFGIYFKLPDDDKTAQPHILTRELGIVTSTDAARCIAMLLGNEPDREALQQPSTGLRWKGYHLLQVYSVHINISGEIYGNIEVKDDLGTYLLYNRQRTDCESIQDSQALTLTGPNRGSTARSFKVSLDLKKRGNSIAADTEISKGSFEWKVDEVNKIFDKHLSNVVKGKSGSATVYYTPFRDALQASVEVVLVHGDGKDTTEINGSLVARYINYDYPTGDEKTKSYYRSTLFNKPSKEKVKVKHGNPIPLLRSVIAVPTMGSLLTDANFISASSGKEIAMGAAEFPPQLDGKTVRDIKGKYGLVRMTVAWKVVSLFPKN